MFASLPGAYYHTSPGNCAEYRARNYAGNYRSLSFAKCRIVHFPEAQSAIKTTPFDTPRPVDLHEHPLTLEERYAVRRQLQLQHKRRRWPQLECYKTIQEEVPWTRQRQGRKRRANKRKLKQPRDSSLRRAPFCTHCLPGAPREIAREKISSGTNAGN